MAIRAGDVFHSEMQLCARESLEQCQVDSVSL